MGFVFSEFKSVNSAEKAIRALLHNNFADGDIGVVVHDSEKGAAIADDLGREYLSGEPRPTDPLTSRSNVYEQVPSGQMDGVHKEHGTDIDSWFHDHLRAGDILVAVNAGDRSNDAMHILGDNGGDLFMRRGDTGTRATTKTGTTTRTVMDEMHVPVIDEEVLVERTSHQVGEVSVTSETTRDQVEVPTTVTHEEIRVERRRLDHAMTPEEYHGMEDVTGTIRLPIVEEEVHVTKTPVVREELVIKKLPVTETKTVAEDVMHTEPHVETHGDVRMREERGGERPAA